MISQRSVIFVTRWLQSVRHFVYTACPSRTAKRHGPVCACQAPLQGWPERVEPALCRVRVGSQIAKLAAVLVEMS